jgi:hypothetical protein
MELRAHRTFYKTNNRQVNRLELAAFVNNKVRKFAPTEMGKIVAGFRQLKEEKIKTDLRSLQVNI